MWLVPVFYFGKLAAMVLSLSSGSKVHVHAWVLVIASSRDPLCEVMCEARTYSLPAYTPTHLLTRPPACAPALGISREGVWVNPSLFYNYNTYQ